MDNELFDRFLHFCKVKNDVVPILENVMDEKYSAEEVGKALREGIGSDEDFKEEFEVAVFGLKLDVDSCTSRMYERLTENKKNITV